MIGLSTVARRHGLAGTFYTGPAATGATTRVTPLNKHSGDDFLARPRERQTVYFDWRRIPGFLTSRRLALAVAFLVMIAGVAAVASRGDGGGAIPETPPETASLAGQLLVATERMTDPRFAHAVIYLARHDASGALGLIVNRAIGDISRAALLDGLDLKGATTEGTIRVRYGGPVAINRGFALHTLDWASAETLRVDDRVGLTTAPVIFRALARGEGPKRSLVLFGYAGWGAGQLESEIARGGWIIEPADLDLIFGADDGRKWDRAIAKRSIAL